MTREIATNAIRYGSGLHCIVISWDHTGGGTLTVTARNDGPVQNDQLATRMGFTLMPRKDVHTANLYKAIRSVAAGDDDILTPRVNIAVLWYKAGMN
ncbi:hypothetical protein G1C97_0886 [Bifidobacterium sp. DSM 109959]|uniref:Uncharacterized protein n=1 Tax=Bifidobacterium olomucense TaxID=2675324 RepID=A0A7Y0HX39_9BIFI|nr:hypothetical protein [Bifidobacterium sp. DSM 109959]